MISGGFKDLMQFQFLLCFFILYMHAIIIWKMMSIFIKKSFFLFPIDILLNRFLFFWDRAKEKDLDQTFHGTIFFLSSFVNVLPGLQTSNGGPWMIFSLYFSAKIQSFLSGWVTEKIVEKDCTMWFFQREKDLNLDF